MKAAFSLFPPFFLLFSCSFSSSQKSYSLAETLWNKEKYPAAVKEFEKVTKRDPKGNLGLQALYRAAMTQTIFLGQHQEAVAKFRDYARRRGDTRTGWQAQLQIGEILFTQLKDYPETIKHYELLLKIRPKAENNAFFQFRIAKSLFFQWKFSEAVIAYRKIISYFPNTEWEEKASYEIGVSYFTSGEQSPGGEGPGMDVYRQAIEAYRNFIQRFPNSPLVSQARFGIASCYEELDDLDSAHEFYQSIAKTYPSPNVIKIKLFRIQERMAQRKR